MLIRNIGDVHRCEELVDGAKRRVIELEFSSLDAAKLVSSPTKP